MTKYIYIAKYSFQSILSQEKISLKLAEIFTMQMNGILQWKLFYLLLKNWTSQMKCLQKGRFSEFIPLDKNERFSFYLKDTLGHTLFKKYDAYLAWAIYFVLHNIEVTWFSTTNHSPKTNYFDTNFQWIM